MTFTQPCKYLATKAKQRFTNGNVNCDLTNDLPDRKMSSIPTRSRLPGPTPSRLPAPSASTKRLASVDLEQGQGEAKKKKLEKGDSSSSLPETNKDLSKAASKFTVGRGGPTKPPARLPNSMMSGRATTIGGRNTATSVSAAREKSVNRNEHIQAICLVVPFLHPNFLPLEILSSASHADDDNRSDTRPLLSQSSQSWKDGREM